MTLNGQGWDEARLHGYRDDLAARADVPVVLPLEEGVAELVPVLRQYVEDRRSRVTTPRA